MDFKFTIGRRIGIGFAIFIIATMVAFILTIITLNDSKTRTETVVSQITPSVADLKEINLLLQRSHTDISKWFYNKSFNDVEFRTELKRIIKKDYPTKKNHLIVLSAIWTPNENQKLKVLFNQIEALFYLYRMLLDEPKSDEFKKIAIELGVKFGDDSPAKDEKINEEKK